MIDIYFFCFSITIILIMLLFFLCPSGNKENRRPFECGFDPMGSSRISFCIKFFIIGIIFLVFDVEVRLILPLPFRHGYMLFFFILMLGLLFE